MYVCDVSSLLHHANLLRGSDDANERSSGETRAHALYTWDKGGRLDRHGHCPGRLARGLEHIEDSAAGWWVARGRVKVGAVDRTGWGGEAAW